MVQAPPIHAACNFAGRRLRFRNLPTAWIPGDAVQTDGLGWVRRRAASRARARRGMNPNRSSGMPGSFTYANKPVVFVSRYDSLRRANWLLNGQPSGLHDATTIDAGADTLAAPVSSGFRSRERIAG